MRSETECGTVVMKRTQECDKEIEITEKDPISMRTYLALAVECMNMGKDFILAVTVTDRLKADEAGDSLSIPKIRRGAVYLAESINTYCFSISYSNPSVMSVSQKEVNDPIKQKKIEKIYYYSISHFALDEALWPASRKNLAHSQDRLSGATSDTLIEVFKDVPVVLNMKYIGNNNDFTNNNVFHQYLQINRIIEAAPDQKLISDRSVQKERMVIMVFFMFIIHCILISFFLNLFFGRLTDLIAVKHLVSFLICVLMLVINIVI